jgi:hypothetical protein
MPAGTELMPRHAIVGLLHNPIFIPCTFASGKLQSIVHAPCKKLSEPRCLRPRISIGRVTQLRANESKRQVRLKLKL